jgi:hypothetical protein
MIELDTANLLKLVLLPLSKIHKAVAIKMSESTPIDENGMTAINCIQDKNLSTFGTGSRNRHLRTVISGSRATSFFLNLCKRSFSCIS